MAIYYTTTTSTTSNDNTITTSYNNTTLSKPYYNTSAATIPYQNTTTATATIPYPNTISSKGNIKSTLEKMLHPNYIDKIEELKPEKVYRFTFNDNTIIKTVCSGEDVFDLRYACFLAIAKKLYSKILTFDGVINESYC